MSHSRKHTTGWKSGIVIALPVFLGILVLHEPAFSQGRRSGDRFYGSSNTDRPEQRTPLPQSELDLHEIPFRIAFESYRETEGRNNWEICLIDADGSNLINLTKTPDINEFYPHASPDGGRICFVADEGEDRSSRSRNIYVMNIDGTGRTRIAVNARQPCWSGDGRRIAYLKGEYSRYNSNSWSNRGLEIYDLATGRVSQHPDEDINSLFNLCWSPDGEWFIASSRRRSSSNVAFRANNTTQMGLSIRGCRPDISPDGKQIAWGRTDYDLNIGTLDFDRRSDNVTDQKAVVACNRSYKVYHVDWSPDSNYLAFSYGSSRGSQAVGGKASGWNICICDLRTGKWTQVTTDGKHCKEPDWIPVRSP